MAALRGNVGRGDSENHWADVAIVYILVLPRNTHVKLGSLEKGIEMHV